MQVLLRWQSTFSPSIACIKSPIPCSRDSGSESFLSLAPLTPLLQCTQSNSITPLLSVHTMAAITHAARCPQLGWIAQIPQPPQSKRAWLPAAEPDACKSRGGHATLATLQRGILYEDRRRLLTGNRHAACGPLTHASMLVDAALLFP